MAQIMIDTKEETPQSLRKLAAVFALLADENFNPMEDQPAAEKSSINGPSLPIELNSAADGLAMVQALLAKPGVPAGTILTDKPIPPPPSSLPTVPNVAAVTAPAALIAPTTGLTPPPPPPTSIPIVSTTESPAPQTGSAVAVPATVDFSQRDKNGFPWDARIHSGSKALTQQGAWKYRRGLEDSVKAAVEAELRATYGIAAETVIPQPSPALPASVPSMPPSPSQPTVQPVSIAPPPPTSAPTVALPPTNGNTPPPPPVTASVSNGANAVDFRTVINKVAVAIATQKLTQGQVNEICESLGVIGGLTGLVAYPDKVGEVDTRITQLIAAAG